MGLFGRKNKVEKFKDLTGQEVNPTQEIQQQPIQVQQEQQIPQMQQPVKHPHTRALLEIRQHFIELVAWIDERLE